MSEKLDLETCITKDNTDVDYLLEHKEFMKELVESMDSKSISAICNTHSCDRCPINGDKFSDSLKDIGSDGSCTMSRLVIIALSRVASDSRICGNSLFGSKTNSCSLCKYYSKKGLYDYCNAWNNFTTPQMYCGYFEKTLDK